MNISTTANRRALQPKLQAFFVYSGRITCQNCFVSLDEGNRNLLTFADLKKLQKPGKKLIMSKTK